MQSKLNADIIVILKTHADTSLMRLNDSMINFLQTEYTTNKAMVIYEFWETTH